jgi:predicted RNase H-like HicB family nuclease
MATYREYLQAAMRHAKFEQMESGEWFASIPSFDGLWVTGSTGEEARKELLEALEGWITVHTRDGNNPLPEIDGITPHDLPGRIHQD